MESLTQRVYGLALGYEDVNDHDDLRHDPLLATLVGKTDPQGKDRSRDRDRGCALAGKSTLNRLERTPSGADSGSRYHKIVVNPQQVDRMLVDVFLDAYDRPAAEIILDLDATDDIIHGLQEGRFFHGYYGDYCYLPLYIFCGDHLLCARLRPSGIDAAEGSVDELDPAREPDQGAAEVAVRRPDQLRHHVGQPAASLVLFGGLPAHGRPAPDRPARNPDEPGSGWNHSLETVQNRRRGHRQRSTHTNLVQ